MRFLLIGLIVIGMFGCKKPVDHLYKMYHEKVSSVGNITDEMVLKYIKTYRELRKNGHTFLSYLSSGTEKQKQGSHVE